MGFLVHPKTFLSIHLINFLMLLAAKADDDQSDSLMLQLHKSWMKEFHVVYNSPDEQSHRYNIYKKNVNFINSFNILGHNYTLSVNQFADLTNEEFILNHLQKQGEKEEADFFPPPSLSSRQQQRRHPPSRRQRRRPPRRRLPPPRLSPPPPISDFLDWRNFGAVNPIRNQKRCGSCWAFGVVSTMESLLKIKTGILPSLSEQELVDCDAKSYQCQGGFASTAYAWVIKNNGLNNRTNYPYIAANGTCNSTLTAVSVATIRNYTRVPTNNETALKEAVMQQPVYVSMDASSIQFYKSGIYNGTSFYKLNHGMTAIGYGHDENGTKYWILRNSWGESWGELGYMRIVRDYCSDSRGACGLAMRPIYPVF